MSFNRPKFINKFRTSQPRKGRVKLKDNCYKVENVGVQLYETIVVDFSNPYQTRLYTGGFYTVSTKAVINVTLQALDLGHVYVHQRKGQWFVTNGDTEVEFTEGMAI
jgi:predicted membrane-bound spermidine synthase